jgi:large subunit ribosomal protein L30e
MALLETIQSALKSDSAIIGYKESIKFMKTNKPKLVIMANNLPKKMKNDIERAAKISGLKLETYNGSSKDLGVICGKPFPVTTIVIKE